MTSAAWSGDLGDDPDATGRLARALAVRGIATGISGGTACLSGVEHLVSHMLDMSNGAAHRPIGLHGEQVGAAGVIAAAAWQLLFDRLETADCAALAEHLRSAQLTASRGHCPGRVRRRRPDRRHRRRVLVGLQPESRLHWTHCVTGSPP